MRDKSLNQLADYIIDNMRNDVFKVAFNGIDTSGKTTITKELEVILKKRNIQVINISIDAFHNPKEIRYRKGKTSPLAYYEDSFDYNSLINLLLKPLSKDGTLQYKISSYDLEKEEKIDLSYQKAHPKTILLFEGVFLFRPEINDYWDLRIFVDISFEECIKRAKQRDQKVFGSAEQVEERYKIKYIPGQKMYMQEINPKENSDIIINNENPNKPILHYQNALY